MKANLKKISASLADFFSGNRRLYCPLCDRSYGSFKSYGVIPRRDAECPGCGSLERHRLLWIALDRMSLVSSGNPKRRMLHVAPEPCLRSKFREIFDYISVDLDGSRAQRQMDITQLHFPDEAFDAIVCNHVLEHVPDDAKALSELYRVLKPDGWACIQVPLCGDTTREDPSVVEPKARELCFGQSDHVRSYGKDYIYRLEDAGFSVIVVPKEKLADAEMLHRISVGCEAEVWISRKRI